MIKLTKAMADRAHLRYLLAEQKRHIARLERISADTTSTTDEIETARWWVEEITRQVAAAEGGN